MVAVHLAKDLCCLLFIRGIHTCSRNGEALRYRRFEARIDECYPGSIIRIEFAVEDLQAFFRAVAEKH